MQHDEVRKFYDLSYYKDVKGPGGSNTHLYWLAKKIRLSPNERLLDIACGTGSWLQAAGQTGILVSGIDISDVAISLCKQVLPDAELVTGIAEELPWSSDTFDVITCLGSLEHFLNKRMALQEMVRVTKKGGRILILVPNADFLTRKLGLYFGTNQANIKEDVLSLESWQELIESVGLTVVGRWKDLHVLSYTWIVNGRWYTWPLRAIQALALVVWPLRWQYQVYFYCKIKMAKNG